LIPDASRPADSLRKSTVPAGDKRQLLDQVLQRAGASAILSIGQGLRDGDFDPLWRASAKAKSPAMLFQGWRRLEGYAHSTNRVELIHDDKAEVLCRRYAVGTDTPPGPAENLLICGVLLALLEMIGCQGIACQMPQIKGANADIYTDGVIHLPDVQGESLDTTTWTIRWQSFETSAIPDASDAQDFIIPLPDECPPLARRIVGSSVEHLSADFLRQWKVGELAQTLGLSQRSLQRRFGEAELSFSDLVRALRIQEASRLLEERETPLGVVGFCAGFSDSAHFSRDFRVITGTTPSAFREALSDT